MNLGKNQPEKKEKWWQKKEKAKTSFPIFLMIFFVKILPFPLLALFAFPVSFFYYIASRGARRAAKDFQKTRTLFCAQKGSAYRQFLSFALCLLEKVSGWAGKASLKNVIFHDDDVALLKSELSKGRGAVLITSHLGNSELLRSLASYNQTGVEKEVLVTAIMDTEVTPQFSKAVSSLNEHFTLDVISSRAIDLSSIEVLQERIQGGGLVVIAGDRISASSPERSLKRDFLGREALFPFGSFYLATLLEAPVYFVFALRERGSLFFPRYNMFVSKAALDCGKTRSERKAQTEKLCTTFVSALEAFCVKFPEQWYNFYLFWEQTNG